MRDDILIFGRGYFVSRIHEGLGIAVSDRKISSVADAEDEVKKYQPKIYL